MQVRSLPGQLSSRARLAHLVERPPRKRKAAGSIPAVGSRTLGWCSQYDGPVGVVRRSSTGRNAAEAHQAERTLGKGEVAGSTPAGGSRNGHCLVFQLARCLTLTQAIKVRILARQRETQWGVG